MQTRGVPLEREGRTDLMGLLWLTSKAYTYSTCYSRLNDSAVLGLCGMNSRRLRLQDWLHVTPSPKHVCRFSRMKICLILWDGIEKD